MKLEYSHFFNKLNKTNCLYGLTKFEILIFIISKVIKVLKLKAITSHTKCMGYMPVVEIRDSKRKYFKKYFIFFNVHHVPFIKK